jgi:tetratricopeptide (TPR) repeat protein
MEIKGENDRAVADLNKAIELNPKFANAYYNRGRVWEKKGDKQRAVADNREYLAIHPSDQDAKDALKRLGASP